VASSLVFGGAGTVPRIQRIGLPDEFLGTGALPTLHEQYGLSTDAIVRSVRGWL
jgi:transketolase